MIEVFKTDVTDPLKAKVVLAQISNRFSEYQANFDLNDCDRILRIDSRKGPIKCSDIISLLRQSGHNAELLEK
jgi:hypothetical protein